MAWEGIYYGCGSWVVRRAQAGPGVTQGHGRRALGHWLGPGNTNVEHAGWVPGIAPSRYTHPGTHPVYHPPGTPTECSAHYTSAVHQTAVLDRPKEILGVDNAPCTPGHASGCVGLLPPPHATSSPAPPLRLLSCIPQYFSVYLSISQYS